MMKSKILTIDDKPLNNVLLKKILKELDVMVFSSTSSKEGIELAQSSNFDLIILDVAMPQMNGFEVCKQLKHDPATKDIPIIFVTATTEMQDIMEGLNAGALDYIKRPFQNDEVKARIKNHLSLNMTQRMLNRELTQRRRTQQELEEEVQRRKYAEIKLENNKNALLNILESSNDGIVVSDSRGFFYSTNRSFCQMLGYNDTECEKRHIWQFIVNETEESWGNLVETIREKDQLLIEKKFLKKTGEIIFTEMSNRTIMLDNKDLIISNIRDITLRKISEQKRIESERKFRTLFEENRDAVFILDYKNNWNIVEANSIAEEIFNVPKSRLIGKPITNLFPEDELPLFEKHFTDKHEAHHSLETHTKGDKHNRKHIEIISTQIELENKKHILAVARDITERKQLSNKLMETIVKTEENERRKIADKLHDGVSPSVVSLKHFLPTLANSTDHEYKASLLADIKSTLDEVIAELRSISHTISPHVLENYGYTNGVESYIKKRRLDEDRAIHIDGNLGEIRLNEQIETVLYRITLELLNNTEKHSQATKVDIEIKLSEDNSKLDLKYRDNGVGFPIEKTFVTQSGLGMTNIRSRVKSINGKLKTIDGSNGSFFWIEVELDESDFQTKE